MLNILWGSIGPLQLLTCASCSWHPSFSGSWNATVHWSWTLAPKQFGFKSGRLQSTEQERLYRTLIQDVDDLKQHLIVGWFGLQQSVTDKAIDQWQNGCGPVW